MSALLCLPLTVYIFLTFPLFSAWLLIVSLVYFRMETNWRYLLFWGMVPQNGIFLADIFWRSVRSDVSAGDPLFVERIGTPQNRRRRTALASKNCGRLSVSSLDRQTNIGQKNDKMICGSSWVSFWNFSLLGTVCRNRKIGYTLFLRQKTPSIL